jgi:hypothetical protein
MNNTSITELEQIDLVGRGILIFSHHVTSSFDVNKTQKLRKHFMIYLSGVIYGLNEGINSSHDLSLAMNMSALKVGVPNSYPFAECNTINYSELTILKHVKYVGEGKMTDLEDEILLQGMIDIQKFLIGGDYSVTNNFYNNFVLKN